MNVKNLLLVLLTILLIIGSCKKDDDVVPVVNNRKTFGGFGDQWGSSVQENTDGGCIITGSWTSLSGTGSDVCLIKTDENGN